ncbi:MAG TPA: biotin--[acetyl-CoA-carboxylase] ligase [Spirochaetia bacterium]|nr:biotin--[acetyl-CoA-carboxylase] ligase [Spirochaetia bacterium]
MRIERVINPFAASDTPSIFFREETVSTMVDAEELARAGRFGTVAVAGYQSGGRGRRSDRSWLCPPGHGLLFTLVLGISSHSGRNPASIDPLVVRPETLPLRAGLALARVLEQDFGLAPQIKWPNDVLIDGRKCSGILCEMHTEYALVAMGVNVGAQAVPPESHQRTPATALALCLETAPEHELLLSQILRELLLVTADTQWRFEIERRMYHRGSTIEFLPDGNAAVGRKPIFGTLVGIDEAGRITIEHAGGAARRSYASGELIIS